MEIKNLIVFPDIHGRIFWKQYINSLSQEEIQQTLFVFLGDYMDPYEYENISEAEAFANFKDIINFKKEHMDNVILLIGNHDCSYLYSKDICSSRYCYSILQELIAFYKENLNLFQLAYEIEYNGKRYVFSHAGIHNKFLGLLKVYGIDDNPDNIVTTLNNLYTESMQNYEMRNNTELARLLSTYSRFRGLSPYDYGSCIWADIREFYVLYKTKDTQPQVQYQVFGHTQLKDNPIIEDTFACLDCRKTFKIENDTIIEA